VTTDVGFGAIVRVYGAALFQIAKEENALEARRAEVDLLLDVLERTPGFRAVLESPRVAARAKMELVRSVLADPFSKSVRSLVLLLIEKNRQVLLVSVLRAFVELHEEEKGRYKAAVESAVPLTPEEAEGLAGALSKMAGGEVILQRDVNPELLGGAVARLGDVIVDGSLRRRFKRLREELLTPVENRGS